jgi:hypothetical protein
VVISGQRCWPLSLMVENDVIRRGMIFDASEAHRFHDQCLWMERATGGE